MKFFTITNAVILAVVALVVIILYISFDKPIKGEYERGNILVEKQRESIIVSGSIESVDDAEIVFQEDGIVRNILKEPGTEVLEGDIVLELENKILESSFKEAFSTLEREQAILVSLLNGASPEREISINYDVGSARQKVLNNKRAGFIEAQKAMVSIEGSVRLEVDKLFLDPESNPNLTFPAYYFDELRINKGRERVEEIFDSWHEFVGADYEDYETVSLLRTIISDLYFIDQFIFEIIRELYQSRNLIEQYGSEFKLLFEVRNSALDYLSRLSGYISTIEADSISYNKSIVDASIEKSSARQEDIIAQRARVAAQEERVKQLGIKLDRTKIRSPFDGLIGDISVDIGEVVRPNDVAVRIISNRYILEVEVTEIDVPFIEIGQDIDAYIESIDLDVITRVRSVNASPIKLNEVSVYKVLLDIIGEVDNLRSGLSADIFVPISEEKAYLTVPTDAIVSSKDKHYIVVEKGRRMVKKEVTKSFNIGNRVVVEGDDISAGMVVFISKKLSNETK